MSWKKERDLLIAQTTAFVQSVTGKAPDVSARPEMSRPPVLPAAQLAQAPLVQVVSPAPARPVDVLPARLAPLGPGDLRDDIRQRVAAFRARQQVFDRDRDAYCNATMAKARAASEEATKIRDNPPPKR